MGRDVAVELPAPDGTHGSVLTAFTDATNACSKQL